MQEVTQVSVFPASIAWGDQRVALHVAQPFERSGHYRQDFYLFLWVFDWPQLQGDLTMIFLSMMNVRLQSLKGSQKKVYKKIPMKPRT